LASALYLQVEVGYGGFGQITRTSDATGATGTRGDTKDDVGITATEAEWRERLVLATELGWDNRDIPYYPTRGGYHRVRVRRVEGSGFASYTELAADLRQFVPLPWRHVLALRAYGRRVDRPVPLEDRLYWGGPETIRGYDYAVHEGDEGYLLSCEYRWPLFLMPISANGRVIGFGLHLFGDAGADWEDGASSGDALVSWGAGVHLNLSTLQLRFEFARTEDGDTVFQFADTFNF
jgi:outer membrane protein assembly factor BamA